MLIKFKLCVPDVEKAQRENTNKEKMFCDNINRQKFNKQRDNLCEKYAQH